MAEAWPAITVPLLSHWYLNEGDGDQEPVTAVSVWPRTALPRMVGVGVEMNVPATSSVGALVRVTV